MERLGEAHFDKLFEEIGIERAKEASKRERKEKVSMDIFNYPCAARPAPHYTNF